MKKYRSMSKVPSWIFRLCFCFLLLCGAAQAVTLYVDGNWSGAESGSISEPFNTIAEGIAALRPNMSDTLYIKGGHTYLEENLAIRVSGADAENPHIIEPWAGYGDVIVDGSFQGHATMNVGVLVSGSYIILRKSMDDQLILRGFEKSGVSIYGDDGAETHDVTLDGLEFIENGNYSARPKGTIRLYYADRIAIQNCVIRSGFYHAINADFCDGDSTTLFRIQNNQIFGLRPLSTSPQSITGINLNSVSYFEVSNNTIHLDLSLKEPGAQIKAIAVSDSSANGSTKNIEVSANILYNDGPRLFYDNCSGIVFMGVKDSVIARNKVYNWGEYGIDIGGGQGASESERVTVEQNLSFNNARGNYAASGISMTGIVFRNNLSYLALPAPIPEEYNGGFDFHGDPGGSACEIAWFNNTHWTDQDSTYYRAWYLTNLQSGSFELKNNVGMVFSGSGFITYETSPTTLDLDYNQWYASGSGHAVTVKFGGYWTTYGNSEVSGPEIGTFLQDYGFEAHAQEGDPLFANGASNLALTAESPCLGAAITLVGFSNDYHDISRRPGKWDIGAIQSDSDAKIPAPPRELKIVSPNPI